VLSAIVKERKLDIVILKPLLDKSSQLRNTSEVTILMIQDFSISVLNVSQSF
jgi:hypothetical protein